ncbi:hypothetical protein MMC28_006758 [Mycoblastus sanguinarius]|nr:hypothetical protein [Mycoblastus sanguinarius]
MGGSIVNSHGRHGAHGDKDFGPRPDRPLRDEEIKAWKIHMVASDGKLTDLQILTEVLSRRECDSKGRPTQFLQEVAPATLDRPNPICRMYEKKASREIEEAKRKATKTTKMQTKQLEVSWAMSDNDLGHRLARLKEFLEKGWRVEVVFGSKRKGWMNKRAASAEEAANVLERIKGAVGEVEGANEWRGMQGKIGGEAVSPNTQLAVEASNMIYNQENPPLLPCARSLSNHNTLHLTKNYYRSHHNTLPMTTIQRFGIAVLKLSFLYHFLAANVGIISRTTGPSMIPTLSVQGDCVYIDKSFRRGRGVKVGDLIDFKHPLVLGQGAVKRVMGMPGDFVVKDMGEGGEARMIQVPIGHCWVLGDNLPESRDSRTYGPIPLGLIKGKIVARVWPLSEIKWLENTLQRPEDGP